MTTRPSRQRVPVTLAASVFALALTTSHPAPAMVVNAVFDSSITSLPNAATIEKAFNTAAAAFGTALTNPVTVNIQVSWGKVNTTAIAAGDVGETLTPDLGFYTYAQVKTALTNAASSSTDNKVLQNLQTSSAAGDRFLIPLAEAKALGLTSATGTAIDGYIGFGSTTAFSFTDSKGTAAGTYDFLAVAKHEIAEVLGRQSGLVAAFTFYAMPFDLFRYSAPGTGDFGYSDAAYASIDGGVTNLGALNNSASGGDRADWLTNSATNDVQDAFIYTGKTLYLSSQDLTILDALGWSSIPASTALRAGIIGSTVTTDQASDVPEPVTLTILASGLAGLAVIRRKSDWLRGYKVSHSPI